MLCPFRVKSNDNVTFAEGIPWHPPMLKIPTGFDLIEDYCWIEQFSPAPQIPRLPGFDIQQNIGPQILMSSVPRVGTPKAGSTIIEVPINELNPIHSVPRAEHSQEHIEAIAQAIAQNGYNLGRPISATRLPDGQLMVTGGHHRLAAMELLGEDTVPVHIFDAANTPPDRLAYFLGIGRITGKYQGTYYPELTSAQLEKVRADLNEWKIYNSEQVKFDFSP